MAAFTSNIDITSGGTYNMDITNGAPASQVANDLNGKFANIQKYLQNGLPEVWTGESLPDSLPNGKSIIFQNKLYVADANNRPQLVATNGSKTEIARFTSTTTWTCPDGVYNVDVWVCGGGGGGASGRWGDATGRYGNCGAGGCGGECIMYRNIQVFPQTSYSIVIGAGGAGGVAPAAVGKAGQRGSNGGMSYFANTTYSARGGSGGETTSNGRSFTGTGRGGDGGYAAVDGTGTMNTGLYGLPGGYNRTNYVDYVRCAIGGTPGQGSSSTYTYSHFLAESFNFDGDRAAEIQAKTHYSGFNPYDGFNYGLGGSGATNYLDAFYDDEYACWSGTLHGGYPNQRLYVNEDFDYIHGSVTCGGGGSCGGDSGNYPHAGGNGGSGLIIIYG